MLVNFDNEPQNSIIYTSAIILEYLTEKKQRIIFEELYNYCLGKKMENALFYISIDWLYLIGVIKAINNKGEVVL